MDINYNYILNNVKELNEDQMIEIYKIFKKNEVKCTINKNGIFTDLKQVDDNIILEIINLIKYLKETKIN